MEQWPAGGGGKGSVVLFSSGNGNSSVSYPASNPKVIAVGAMSMCDERKNPASCDGENWWGGDYGTNLDVSAPGVKIQTTDISGAAGFTNGDYIADFNGTSSACPNAAGVMALILSVNPNLTQLQARSILEGTCDKTGGYTYTPTVAGQPHGSWSNDLGHGRVNAARAVAAAANPDDIDMDNYTVAQGDCNDFDASIHPNAMEICDFKDNDCDGQTDEGFTIVTCYRDLDQDNFGNPTVSQQFCAVCGAGYVLNNTDCNDNNNAVYPNATEICDLIDNDCDGTIDEGFDADMDGYTVCAGDCNDNNSNINPGKTEICNGIDDNCDGVIDFPFITYASTDVPKTISNVGTSTVTSTITISGVTGNILDLNVRNLTILHTWIGDLKATLTAPNGTIFTLFDQPGRVSSGAGCSQNHILATFDDEAALTAANFESTCNTSASPVATPTTYAITGTYQPINTLATLIGTNPNGTWTLTVSDAFSADGGSLTGWGLEIGLPSPTTTYYVDADGDTYGDPNKSVVLSCVPTSGFSLNNADCNDQNAAVYPGSSYMHPVNTSPPTTCGGSDGSISLSGFAPNTTYSVSYIKGMTSVPAANFTSNGTGVIIIPNLSAGNYTNIVATSGTCASNPASAILNDPVPPTAGIGGNNSPICAGANATFSVSGTSGATLTYTLTGLMTPQTLLLDGTSQTISATNATADVTLTLVSVTKNNCNVTLTANSPVTVLNPATPVATGATICKGGSTTLTATGCVGAGLVLKWYKTTDNASVTMPVSPTVTMEYYAKCEQTLNNVTCLSPASGNVTVTVLNPVAPVASGATICTGGSATLTATGCSGAGLVLKWYQTADNAAVTMPVSPTVSTQYYAKCEQTLNNVTCASPSSGNVTVTVLSPSAPVATGATICTGGSTTLTATGCSGAGLVLKWYQTTDNAAVTMPVSPTMNTQYYAKCEQTLNNVTCVSPASSNVTVTVLNPAAPVATGATICTGGSATLTATGCSGSGLVLKWYKTADNAAVTMPVSPTVNTQYYAKCEQTFSDPMCFACVQPQGNIVCLSPASGNVTVTVLNPAAPVATGATICAGGSVTLTATGCVGSGLVLKWYQTADNASVTMPVSPMMNTQYYAKCEQTLNNVTCASASSGNVTVTVLSPAAPVATGATICAGGSTTLTATGCSGSGLVLKWYQTADNASVTMPVSPMMNTQYYAKCEQTLNNVTCASASSGNVTVTVLSPAAPVATGGATICAGGSATLTATGCVGSGLVLKWYKTTDNSSVTMPVSPTVTTQYYAKCEQTLNNVTCSSAASGNVTVTVLNPAVPVASGATICAGGSVTLTVTGCVGSGLVLKWYQTADNAAVTMPVSPMVTTQYYAKCEQTLNNVTCSSAASGNVTVTVLNPAAPVATGATICAGGSVTLTATGCVGSGLVLKWYQTADNAAVTMPVSPTMNTQYYAKCEQTLNNVTCASASSGNVTVTVNPLPTASIAGTTQVCQNAPFPQVTFTGGNGTAPYTFTYKINGGADLTVTTVSGNSVSVAQTTAVANTFSYTLVSVKDASSTQCSQIQSGSATITVNALPVVSTPQTSLCTGLTMTLSPTSGGTWQSSNPSIATVNNAGVVTAIMAGSVNFTFTQTSTGCSSTTSNVTIKPTPSSNLTASKVDVCANTEVTLNPNCSIPTSTVNWNPGAPTVTPAAATLPYIYKARCVADGCVGNETSVEVRTHRILVDMKDLDVGALPLPIVRSVKDNMSPTNLIQAPVFPRRWTFIANGCDASESAEFKLSGPVLFNAIDNAGTYAMFANEGNSFYSIDHPNYGNGGSFPDGTYTLTINLRSKDGAGGPYPKNRVATGALLATRTLQFTVGGQQAIVGGRQSAVGSEQWVEGSEPWAVVVQNPVNEEVVVRVLGKVGEEIDLSLVNLQGQMIQQRGLRLTSSEQNEVLRIGNAPTGLYILKAIKGDKVKTIKVVKVD